MYITTAQFIDTSINKNYLYVTMASIKFENDSGI